MTTLKRWNGTDYEYVGLPTNVGMSPQTLAFAKLEAQQLSISSEVDVTSLSVTVTVPEGRRIRITGHAQIGNDATAGMAYGLIKEGTTVLGRWSFMPLIASSWITANGAVVISPTAGTHTYKLTLQKWGGGGTLYVDAAPTYPAYILVEDITGSTLPYQPASVPVGLIAQSVYSAADLSVTGTADIPTLSLNINIPAGRVIKLRASSQILASAASDWFISIMEGGVEVGRPFTGSFPAAGYRTMDAQTILSPTAGAHTYTLKATRFGGSGNLNIQPVPEIEFSAEDITPTPTPASTAPSSTLGYVEAITAAPAIGAGPTDIPSLQVTVTVPAGRRLRISGNIPHFWYSDATTSHLVQVYKNGALFGTLAWHDRIAAGESSTLTGYVIDSPSAGTHTYKLVAVRGGGGGTVLFHAAATEPQSLLVEDITGVGVAGHTHTQLDDTGWISLVPYLVNGWVSYDNTYGPPRFRKKAGVVYVQGLVKNGTIGTVIATLPPGFRTSGVPKLLFAVNANDGDTGGSRVDVDTNGNIIHIGARNTYYSLSGIIYPVD